MRTYESIEKNNYVPFNTEVCYSESYSPFNNEWVNINFIGRDFSVSELIEKGFKFEYNIDPNFIKFLPHPCAIITFNAFGHPDERFTEIAFCEKKERITTKPRRAVVKK